MAEFKFPCPRCGQNIQCDTGYAGTQINCPACQQAIVVPQVADVSAPPPSPAATAPGRKFSGTPVAQPATSPKSHTLRNILVAAAAVLVLAGLGWFGYSMFTRSHLPPGLVGLWSGEGSGKNSAASGTAILTDVFFAEGKVGQAFSFNQPTSAIKISARRALNVGAGPGLTIMAWGNPSDLSQRNETFEWNNGSTWGAHVCMLKPQEFGLGAGNLFADVHNVNGQVNWIMARGGTIKANTFQHIALTYDKDSGIARLFCNGKIAAEKQFGHFTPQTSYDFYVGRRPAGDGTHSFSGLIDEVGLFNRALSPEEIKAIYARQK